MKTGLRTQTSEITNETLSLRLSAFSTKTFSQVLECSTFTVVECESSYTDPHIFAVLHREN